jgi:hypothetical protein
MPPRFQDEETFPDNREQIVRACLTVLRERRFAVKETDIPQGWIRARAPMSSRSWGENLTITVSTNGKTEIISESRVRTTLVDWGKNKANVNELLSRLRSALGS